MLEFLLTLLCLGLVAVIAVVAYRYYRKRKEEEQRGGYTPTDPFADSVAIRGRSRRGTFSTPTARL